LAIYDSICKPDGVIETIVLTALKHEKVVHEFPNGTNHDTVVICFLQKLQLLPVQDFQCPSPPNRMLEAIFFYEIVTLRYAGR